MSARPEQTGVRIWFAKGFSYHILVGKRCDAEDVAGIRLRVHQETHSQEENKPNDRRTTVQTTLTPSDYWA